jgi:hypothetical protein
VERLNGKSGTREGHKAWFSRIPAAERSTLSASSGMAAGERNRTDAFDLCRTCEDASFHAGGSEYANERVSGALSLALSAVSALAGMALLALAGTASAQVKFTLGGDLPATGPGTKYPTILTCNETNAPQTVEGWKFKTKDFAGFSTWMSGLTKSGTAPVEYTQPIPVSERQMQAGNCRIAPTDYTGTLAAGQDATPFDLQALIKTGSCTELPPYKDAAALACNDIVAANIDRGNQCIIDSIGSNGGDNYGGFVSSFYGQTQIQAVIPSATFAVSGDNVRWNPYAMGPQYMMALAAAQEILNVDMQFLAAIAGKETGAGIQSVATGLVRSELPDYQDNGTYGYWQIEQDTYATYIKAYPQFFPKYGPCLSKYPDGTSAISAGHCVDNWGTVAKFYMQPAGKTKMTPNSPQLTNGALSSAMAWYGLYDALSNSTDLCFVDAIKNGVDKRIAFAAMIGGYNLGRYTDFGGPLKDPLLKNDPNASSRFATGNNNYRTDIYRILDNLVDASKNCGTRRIYDTTITLVEVQRQLFGGSVTPGTAAVQGDGGLMLHYPLDAAQREAMWTEVSCAFTKLAAGKPGISFRYDYLTLLRVVKKHLPFHIKDRKIPVEHDFQYVVDNYSKNPQTCSGKSKDMTYPSMTITTPAANSVVSPIINPGARFAFTGTDNVAVAKAEWTFDKNWLAWNPALKAAAANSYEFFVSCEMPGYPKKNAAAALWIRTTDDCGNSTVQQLDFRTHSTANCGDPPVPPQVATPIATPTGREFSALSPGVSVTLNVATSGASILYTLDGSEPDSVVGGKTLQFAGPILIKATTTLKARGVMDGMSASTVMTEVYTLVQPGKVATPTANPPGKSFSGNLSVILLSATPATVIWYTLDGTIPDSSGSNATRLTAPIILKATTTITAIAVKDGMYKSGVMVEQYTFIPPVPPVAVAKAWYLDENGDGRIEKAVLEFAKAIAAAPAKLGFTIVDEDGNSIVRNASGAEISLAAGNAARAVAVFSDPFPQGVTSLKNAATSGQTFAQEAIPLIDGAFPVADSVAPVITAAEVKEPGDGGALKRVIVTYSETVVLSAGGQPIIVKRGNAETPGSSIILAENQNLGPRQYAFHVDSNSAFFPIVGDSAAITLNGQTADASGNAPKAKFFRVMKGVAPKAKPVSLTITFPNGSQKDPSSGSAGANRPDVIFIPVDKDGNALPSKCGGCTARDARGFVGPVFRILTPGPVEYEFKIFNTAGEFVAEGKGKVEKADLDLLKRSNDASGIKYEAAIVWTGSSRSGNKASTGAYILKASFVSEKDLTTGAEPTRFSDKKVFGMIRNCCGS